MAKKKVSFIATKQKRRKMKISFYTKEGKKVVFDAVKKVPKKERVEFYVKSKKKKS